MLFIAIGFWAFLEAEKMSKESEVQQEQSSKPAPTAESTAPQQKPDRSAQLNALVIPSNLPKNLNLYFGSQSGTAEKFCQVLDEEAQ